MVQSIITADNDYAQLSSWLIGKKVFLVCDSSLQFLSGIKTFLETKNDIVYFSDFQPNPLYESVVKGVSLFLEEKCDAIMAVGGGSAIDVAKCVKLYCNMDHEKNYLTQEITPNNIPFLAMPTTAGTGSEATRFAVIYYNGAKQSVAHESCIPETILMDSSVLKTLPIYQKKSTMMDALCHAIESYWSVNSTDESKEYSREAIKLICENRSGYLANDDQANANMLFAANIAGKAINITQTTAGHAMCYKITSLFCCAHGHAAILCDRILFPWMIENIDKCIDARGENYLRSVLDEIGKALGGADAKSGAGILEDIFQGIALDIPTSNYEQYEILKTSVNPDRLKNHPVRLSLNDIDALYHKILR